MVDIIPNEAAIIRLVGAVLQEQTEEWAVGRRSISEASLQPVLGSAPEDDDEEEEAMDPQPLEAMV